MTFEEYWWMGVCANPNMARDALLKQIAESAWNAGATAERKACAKECAQLSHMGSGNQLWMRDRCVAVILARSNVQSDRLAEDKGSERT